MDQTIFGWQDLGLSALLGLVIGAWVTSQHGKGHPKDEPFSRLIRAFWEPVTYWLDLRGIDNRPSISKITYFAGAVVVLWGEIIFGLAQFRVVNGTVSAGITTEFIFYTVVTLTYCLGKEAFNKVSEWLMGRFPVLAEAKARQSGQVDRPPEAGA